MHAALASNDSADRYIGSLALAAVAADRVLGLLPFDCQLAGAWALMRGWVIEMETGEGKSLTATLAAASAALCGIPVHVVTVNDYLAQRDSEQSAPLYDFIGLTSSLVLSSHTDEQRRCAYASRVVHVTARELAFDYLRDRLALGHNDGDLRQQLRPLRSDANTQSGPRLPGLAMAIIDEIDSILIDEARQPLVISHQAARPLAQEDLVQARADAASLQVGEHFLLHHRERRVQLTEPGKQRLAGLAKVRDGRWRLPAWREEIVRQSLAAEHLYRRGEDYVLRDDRVAIVDENTGRVAADRSWSAGLHEMLELKEACPPRTSRLDVGRLTYQRFFRRYRHLAGMTGTAREVARELWSIYRLPLVRLPTNRPLRRVNAGMEILPTQPAKWHALAERVSSLHRSGRPVLVGTRTVNAAQAASAALEQLGLPHVVLSAAQDAQESAVVAQAGQARQITIATNMAGRGTDIRLGQGIAEMGGLHVVMSEMHEAGRIDRQLAGRCARQGDPGSWEAILSWDDPLLRTHLPEPLLLLVMRLPLCLRSRLAAAVLLLAQRRAQWLHAGMRRQLLRADDRLDDLVSFSGSPR